MPLPGPPVGGPEEPAAQPAVVREAAPAEAAAARAHQEVRAVRAAGDRVAPARRTAGAVAEVPEPTLPPASTVSKLPIRRAIPARSRTVATNSVPASRARRVER